MSYFDFEAGYRAGFGDAMMRRSYNPSRHAYPVVDITPKIEPAPIVDLTPKPIVNIMPKIEPAPIVDLTPKPIVNIMPKIDPLPVQKFDIYP